MTSVPFFCSRCAAELQPGKGDFYLSHIEALADPAPPILEAADPAILRHEIERLMAQAEEISEQEALDQVYRRLSLYLCGPCYRRWIENPTG